ncbi:chalcone isomerase family protein [Parashewanella tropica]|uniref:chalcone isomerase family protein n=1 Tax=Parashewanella tropica TaxID=2547970 RepID=UPI001059694D|nr:chalcone isomerase family protein [Parashewanella tropica]
MRNFIICILFCTSLFTVQVAQACSIRFPDMESDTNQLKKLGGASFSFLFWDLYKSTLYTSNANKPRDANEVLFKIQYKRDIDKKDLVEQTQVQWEHLKLPPKEYQSYLPELENIWPNVKKGDTLALLVSNKGSSFYLNQACIGTIADPHFGKRFLDIWLSPNTSEPKQRKRLLGARR